MYMTALDDPTRVIAEPAGFFMAPEGDEYIGDVMNVLFSNGWIADEDGKVFIYYASSDTRMHVATSSIDRLVERLQESITPAEVILALSGDVEGETTSFYIYRKIAGLAGKISTLARGLGFGDDLEYADSLTLGRSIVNRQEFRPR